MKYLLLAVLAISLFACSGNKAEHASTVIPQNEKMSAAEKPVNIEGTYVLQNENDCGLKIVIARKGNGYTYLLTTNTRSVKGNAVLSKEDKGTYITFEGIPWDSYEGDISEIENDEERSEPRIPDTMSCLVENNTITIQNTGNSMNSYTKLSECSDKYIVLVKV